MEGLDDDSRFSGSSWGRLQAQNMNSATKVTDCDGLYSMILSTTYHSGIYPPWCRTDGDASVHGSKGQGELCVQYVFVVMGNLKECSLPLPRFLSKKEGG
jgi:hypothetical protein